MRTNIVLNDSLLREAQRYARGKTRRAIVEEALETYVAVKAAERRRASYAERSRALEERTRGLRLRERPSELLREDRNRG